MKIAPQPAKVMTVAGVMSGTSADGVDVALVRVSPAKSSAPGAAKRSGTANLLLPKIRLLGRAAFPYPRALRRAVLEAMDASSISTAAMARLHWRLGEFYGDCIQEAQRSLKLNATLAGVHGQTVYHQGAAQTYLGKPLRCTWQLGEASETAARIAMPVVSDFRPADLAVGGQAAPLVPVFDLAYFAHGKRNRVLQNLGGIANMTAIPAGSADLLAFDSGPASVVIDGCMQSLYGKPFDRSGAVAKRGVALRPVLERALRLPYFAAPPPKSCGREQFGGKYISVFIDCCRRAGAKDADIVATATALTAESILGAYRTFVWPHLGQLAPLADATDYIVAGGGANNATLMHMLKTGLEPLGVQVSTSHEHGVPANAKEAMAFALLAWLRWHNLPGNIPSATGAKRAVPLGRITLP